MAAKIYCFTVNSKSSNNYCHFPSNLYVFPGTQLCHVASIVCDMTSSKSRVTMIDDVKEIEQSPDDNRPDDHSNTPSPPPEQYSN